MAHPWPFLKRAEVPPAPTLSGTLSGRVVCGLARIDSPSHVRGTKKSLLTVQPAHSTRDPLRWWGGHSVFEELVHYFNGSTPLASSPLGICVSCIPNGSTGPNPRLSEVRTSAPSRASCAMNLSSSPSACTGRTLTPSAAEGSTEDSCAPIPLQVFVTRRNLSSPLSPPTPREIR